MANPSDIIHRAGGDEAVADACGVSLDALRKWREMGRVPSKHWGTVAGLAKVPLDVVAAATLARPKSARKAA